VAFAKFQGDAPKMGRRMRRPQHRFQIRQRAWQIQPFLIAPVLPGETLRSLLWQARVVSDPLKSPLIGWWAEYYVFYVKLRDLAGRDDFSNMMIDPSQSMAAYLGSSEAVGYYTFDGGIIWVEACLQRVVEEYFRDEGETWNTAAVDSIPLAQVNLDSWAQNVTLDTDMQTFDVDPSSLTSWDAGTGGDPLMASEIDKVLRQYQLLKTHGVTEMSFDDYLRSFGIKVPEASDPHRPELIRYARDWTYPTNTIDPSTGAPTSAVSWVISERADKDRFFTEPGFIFGVSVMRPKVYLSAQKGAGVGMLDNAYAWLPAILRSDPQYSWKQFAETEGPLDGLAIGGTTGYWVDLTDLFMHGDQFVNFALSATDANLLGLPASGSDDMHEIRGKYVTEAMCEGLFVDDDDSDGKTRIRSDGVAVLNIASSLRDMSPDA
jgi:hypothetical protein